MKQNENFGRYCLFYLLLCIDEVLIFYVCVLARFSLGVCEPKNKKFIWKIPLQRKKRTVEHLFYVYSCFVVAFSLISVRLATCNDCIRNGPLHFIGQFFFWILRFVFFVIATKFFIQYLLFMFFSFLFMHFLHFSSPNAEKKAICCRFCPWIMGLKCESHLAIFRMIFLLFF